MKKSTNPEIIEAIKQYTKTITKLEELHKPFFSNGVIIQEISYFMDYKVNIIIKKDEQTIYKISYDKQTETFNPEIAINVSTNLTRIIFLLLKHKIKTYTFHYDRLDLL